jgi:hypothetical protein
VVVRTSRFLTLLCSCHRYHNARQRREGKGTALYEHAVRSNDTMDAMGEEQKLLAMNLISVGGILNEFTYTLFQDMGWKAEVDLMVQTTPDEIKTMRRADGRRVKPGSWEASDQNFERYIMVLIFSQRLLGVLDFSAVDVDDVVSQQIDRAAACFERFFGSGLDPGRVMFFTPVEEEQEI